MFLPMLLIISLFSFVINAFFPNKFSQVIMHTGRIRLSYINYFVRYTLFCYV